MDIPAWIAKLDFCWFAEDERGCIAIFNSADGRSLHFIPELVKKQYTEYCYSTLMEVVLDILPITNEPRIVQNGFPAWDSARGLYVYVYNAKTEQFDLASMPNDGIDARALCLHSPAAFECLVLRLRTVEYALKAHISVKEIEHLLARRKAR